MLKFMETLFVKLLDRTPAKLISLDCEGAKKCILNREGVKKNNYFFSSLLLLRGPATPPPP